MKNRPTQCPSCKSKGPFIITARIFVNEGEDAAVDEGWNDDNACVCKNCGHGGIVGDFLKMRIDPTRIVEVPEDQWDCLMALLEQHYSMDGGDEVPPSGWDITSLKTAEGVEVLRYMTRMSTHHLTHQLLRRIDEFVRLGLGSAEPAHHEAALQDTLDLIENNSNLLED